MYDITNSKYKQLCEIRKVNSENLVIAEEEKQAEWEPKARRMIQLYLTDGLQNITAIEYKPLKQMTVRIFTPELYFFIKEILNESLFI